MPPFVDSRRTFRMADVAFRQIHRNDRAFVAGVVSLVRGDVAVLEYVLRNLIPVGQDPRWLGQTRTVRREGGGKLTLVTGGMLPTERVAGEITVVGTAGDAIIYDCVQPEPFHVQRERLRRGLEIHQACRGVELPGERAPLTDPELFPGSAATEFGPIRFGAPIFATRRPGPTEELGEPSIVGGGLFPPRETAGLA